MGQLFSPLTHSEHLRICLDAVDVGSSFLDHASEKRLIAEIGRDPGDHLVLDPGALQFSDRLTEAEPESREARYVDTERNRIRRGAADYAAPIPEVSPPARSAM